MSTTSTFTPASTFGDRSSETPEELLLRTSLYFARLQLFVASALIWLIAVIVWLSVGVPAPVPTIALVAWLSGTTLILSILATRGGLKFLQGPLPGRVALFSTVLTVLLSAMIVRDASGDFYLIYFFPIVVATIYYGLRGGLVTALLSAVTYVLLVMSIDPSPLSSDLASLLFTRVFFLIAVAAALGIDVEGRFVLMNEMRNAFADMKASNRVLESTRESLARHVQELQQAQEQMVRMERLRALGEMAGGVAHDFNNLLTVILAEAQLLNAEPHTAAEKESFERIEQAARDGAQAVRRIQEYTRIRQDTPNETVDINGLVEQSVEFTRPRWQPVARLQVEKHPVGSVIGNPAELREVLTNLIFNAVDARVEGTECRIIIRTEREPSGWIKISVIDNGAGIPQEIRDQIFEPYFTTKSHGTGLGLSVAYGIIVRHGGEIHVTSPSIYNGQDRGTRFEIRLPMTAQESQAKGPEVFNPIKRFERILVVDDDMDVLNTASRLLGAIGYTVTTACTARDVGQELSRGDFDVLMTDLAMPPLSGWDVARRSKEMHPEKPVILVTGWGLQLDPEKLNSGVVDAVLTKPFTLKDLEVAMERLPRLVKNATP